MYFTDQYINDKMIKTFRNFTKKKLAGILLILVIIIAFGFGGFGGGFNPGNQNNIAKINNTNISTQDFMNYLNGSGISQKVIRDNLDKGVIEELLSGLISETLLNLEIKDFDISITELILLKKIKENKIFLDEKKVFQRTKYEKFLLSNNMSAPMFEQQIKNRELQKNLFDFIGAGAITPNFLVQKIYEDENRIMELKYFDLNNFYKKKEVFTEIEIKKFIEENDDQLKREYIDFKYVVLNPKNLIGMDDFNQKFFDEIDKIENKISQGQDFDAIIEGLNIKPFKINEYTKTSLKKTDEDRIFLMRASTLDIVENGNNFLLFNIIKKYNRSPDLKDKATKEKIIELVYQKSKFDLNREILEKIENKKFNDSEFEKMGGNIIQNVSINSIEDTSKFNIDSIRVLYSLPVNSFTLVNDKENVIYLVKIISSQKKSFEKNDNTYLEFVRKQNANNKSTILSSYDTFLNNKYKIELNQKTIDRVKNYFK